MPLTIKDYLDTNALPDGFVVPHLTGKVKIAWQVKPGGSASGTDFGPSQGFVLANADGEIQIQLGSSDEADFPGPVEKGDEVEIFSTPHGKTGAPSGNKLSSYKNKDGKLVRQIKVYGRRRFKNLTRPSDPPETAAPAGQGSAAAPNITRVNLGPGMYEAQAVAAYLRLYTRFAAELSPRLSPAIRSLEGFIIEAPVELLGLCHQMTYGLFVAVLTGEIVPEHGRNAAAPSSAATTAPPAASRPIPDPDWLQGLEEP